MALRTEASREAISSALWRALYYGLVTPAGVLSRSALREPFLLKRDGRAQSYWITRKRQPSLPSLRHARNVLGISAYYHDSAAALVRDGAVCAAAQEERFTRRRHDARFPGNAVKYCLSEAGIRLGDVDAVVFYESPILKFRRLLETFLAYAPNGSPLFTAAAPLWIKEKLWQRKLLSRNLEEATGTSFDPSRLHFAEHHFSHAASAFFPSPFESAAILTIDGVGESATTTLAVGRGNEIRALKEIRFPHSLGLLYSAFTAYAGFRINSGEYKLMGLAPYGVPKYRDVILDNLIDVKDDGSFLLNLDYFDYHMRLRAFNERFESLMGAPARKPEQELEQHHMDVAASIQSVFDEILIKLARFAARETGEKALCLAGGVALNCVSNGKLLRAGVFDKIWIQPAAGDAGGALGAAFVAEHMMCGRPRKPPTSSMDAMKGSYLGPSFTDDEIASRLDALGARYEKKSEQDFIQTVAQALASEQAVGWFQGRMEFGPRALGARSILGDPRSPRMQRVLNLKVKFRESFRPFAPSVLAEDVSRWFEMDAESPYMLLVCDVVKGERRQMTEEEQRLFGIEKLNVVRSSIPAVTHVDYSARVQTVHRETNARYYDLLKEFRSLTGVGLLVNTSFNIRGEPIVCTPEDAFRCFMGTDLDVLAIGNFVLRKEEQPAKLKQDYRESFDLD